MKKMMMTGVLMSMALVGCTTTPLPPKTVQSSNPQISISADRTIALNGQTVNLADIGASLAAMGQSKDAPIQIRADKSVPFQTVTDVVDHLRVAGYSHIGIATR